MRSLRDLNILVILLFLGCSSRNSQTPAAASQGAGALVAGCNFSDLDQNYSYDIVVSGSDNVSQGQKLRAVIYDRSGPIRGIFSVEAIAGSAGSQLLETIQSTDDGGASFKVDISNTVSTRQSPPIPSIYASNLVHAVLTDGSQINNRGLLCSPSPIEPGGR